MTKREERITNVIQRMIEVKKRNRNYFYNKNKDIVTQYDYEIATLQKVLSIIEYDDILQHYEELYRED